MALRTAGGRGAELRVHPLVFAVQDAVPLLERYARSGGRDGHLDLRRLGGAVVAAVRDLDQPPARCFLPVLTPDARERLVALDDELAARGIRLQLNDNRRLLLSLRHERGDDDGLALGIHYALLEEPAASRLLLRYATRRGRGRHRDLDACLRRVFERICARSEAVRWEPPAVPIAFEDDLATVGDGFDLQALAARVHATWFADLPPLPVRWGRNPGAGRQLRSIHFGTFRSRPHPQIRIHPRLARPWIAHCFVEHVLHHEYCHWRQHREPVRGEKHHSPRFKGWERAYPHYTEALAWQRANLTRILAPDHPDA